MRIFLKFHSELSVLAFSFVAMRKLVLTEVFFVFLSFKPQVLIVILTRSRWGHVLWRLTDWSKLEAFAVLPGVCPKVMLFKLMCPRTSWNVSLKLFFVLSVIEAPPKPEENPAEAFTDSSLFAHWGQDLSPENRRIALKQFQYYGYNAYLSDRLPLDRRLPDLRPNG